MAVQLFNTGTEYVANQITLLRGDVADILAVGVLHLAPSDPVPAVEDFTTVTLVDGTAEPPDPLSEAEKIDVLSLIGPKIGADLALEPGTYQRWVLVQTAAEDIIRRPDTVTVV